MLETLHRIIQKVNACQDLDEALNTIVSMLRESIDADVCSVYLTDFERHRHVLRASVGLSDEAIGRVSLPLHRGLVGLVCERAEVINVADALRHKHYFATAETTETDYHGFLGAPILQQSKVLGVLVIRNREPGKIDDEVVTFVLTLAAQLAGAITHAGATGELATFKEAGIAGSQFLKGRASSNGIAIGTAFVTYLPADLETVPDRLSHDRKRDQQQLRDAIQAVQQELRRLKEKLSDDLPEEDRALFDAWLMILSEDALTGRAMQLIAEAGMWAPAALRITVEEHARVFDAMEDIYLRERASDIRDLGRRVLSHLQQDSPLTIDYPEHTILVGEEVSAVQLAEVPRPKLAGVVSATGSNSSHVAILSRALGVPALMGVDALPSTRLDGRELILDGYSGRLYVSPQPSVRIEYERLAEEERALSAELDNLRGLPVKTTDGVHIPLYLNTGLLSDMSSFGIEEADGVGLYRTEFPFMVRDRFPGEEAQVRNYRQVLQSFAPRPVVLRTLDIGGDKPLPYFPVKESNPFLGWRGVRISLDHPEIFLTQLRAMLRASDGLDNLHIMLPMVTSVAEVDQLLALIKRAHRELLEEGYAVMKPKTGVMIEVPAAVYNTAAIAKRVDFISIGSNDLTQYLLAVDRNNPRVAELYSDLHPAVLYAIMQVVEGARQYNCPVGVCGELAGNPLATALLVGMGVDSLSMSAGSLLRVKRVISTISQSHAIRLLRSALQMNEADEIAGFMSAALENLGLDKLLKPGQR
ncbi:MAG: phosphoenolpyruvate--protein phosphotransferase [Pseudomonadota bacterium]